MLRKTLMVLGSLGAVFGVSAMKSDKPLEVGAKLPAVKVKTHLNAEIDLAEAGAKGYVLVYFYPKADTPGCTKQACSLRDEFATLTEKGVAVFGVSVDSVADQKAFAEKYTLPFTLLADTQKALLNAFGVPTYPGVGMAKRQAFLFKDGVLVWRDLTASTDEQAADVLKELK